MSSDRAAQLVEAGIWLKLSGDREGARKLFERALKLDPQNTKAAQLLAGAPAPGEEPAPPAAEAPPPVPPAVPTAAGRNPFERPSERSATDWGQGEGPPVSLDSDWGRLTGAATPVPSFPPAQAPVTSSSSNVVLGESPVPAVPPVAAPPARVPPKTMLFTPPAQPAPKTTLQLFGAPEEAPADAGPVAPSGMPEPGRAAKKTALQFGAPSPSGPGASRRTMQFVVPPEVRQAQAAAAAAATEAAPSGPAEQGRVSKTMQFAAPSVPAVQAETFDFSAGPVDGAPAAPALAQARPPKPTMQEFGSNLESETFDFSATPVPLAPPVPPVQPGGGRVPARTMQFAAPGRLAAPVVPETFDFGADPVPLPAATPTGLPEDSRFSEKEMQLFGSPQDFDAPVALPAKTVELGGDPGPEAPPPSTPPLFGASHDSQPALAGHVPAPSPSTPPLFASLPVAAPSPRSSPGESAPAWSWSNAHAPEPEPAAELEPTPSPRPSPSLAPRATSAWDQRSNPGIKLEAVVGPDRALDLLSSDSKITRSPEARKEEIRTILRGARDLLDLDDHSGAMELILKAQSIAPDDPDVLAMRERSEKTLLAMFESKLGKLETVPRVLLKDDEIIWLNLDHRAGFVLAQIDGTVSFDDLFSVSGMSRIDTARILAQLVEEGVISRG